MEFNIRKYNLRNGKRQYETKLELPYIPDYKTRFFAKFKASKSKGRLIHRE